MSESLLAAIYSGANTVELDQKSACKAWRVSEGQHVSIFEIEANKNLIDGMLKCVR